METAIEYGERNCASDEEITQISDLPEGTTQQEWYDRICRGCYIINRQPAIEPSDNKGDSNDK